FLSMSFPTKRCAERVTAGVDRPSSGHSNADVERRHCLAASAVAAVEKQEAFWLFVCLMKKYELASLFVAGLPGLRLLLGRLDVYCRQLFPAFSQLFVRRIRFSLYLYLSLPLALLSDGASTRR